MKALPFVLVALCVPVIAYRYYGKWRANLRTRIDPQGLMSDVGELLQDGGWKGKNSLGTGGVRTVDAAL
jgi:hypothetical protein